ncbi:MAG: hypothetical protein R3F23_09235 [Verrucomicrobiia bacterium]
MSLYITNTQAGDNSDGKYWGIEGMNILIIIVGLALTVTSFFSLNKEAGLLKTTCVGSTPLIISIGYVFGFRQGKPKAYDIDLLETIASGSGWQPDFNIQKRNPLYESA